MQLHVSFSDLYEFGKNEHSEKDTVGFILKYCDDIDKVMNELSQEDSSIISKFSDKIVSHYGGLGKLVAECGMTEFTSSLLLSYLENGKINEIIEQVSNDDIKKFLNILLKEGSIVDFDMEDCSISATGYVTHIKNCDDIPSIWVCDMSCTKCNDSVKQLIIYYLKNTFGEVYLDTFVDNYYTNKKPFDYLLDYVKFSYYLDRMHEIYSEELIQPNFNLIKNNRKYREALEVLNENDTYEEFYDKLVALSDPDKPITTLLEDTDFLEVIEEGIKRMKLI